MKKIWVLFCLLFSSTAATEEISLAFVGDVLLAGKSGLYCNQYGMSYPFKQVAPILSEADLAMANLECALTGKVMTRNVRVGNRKLYIFKTPPRYGKSLVQGNVDIVTLANNHTMNGGRRGIIETIQTLDNIGIAYCGAGKNESQARSPRILHVKGKKIAFFGYTDLGGPAATHNFPGIALLKDSLPSILSDIRLTKQKVDFVIVNFHWGIEGRTKPTQRQQQVAKKIIDAGADLVIGHHPHCLQPVETYKGKTIAYSLGNFVFDNPRPLCARTMILKVIINTQTKKQRIQTIPCYTRNSQPSPSR